MRGRTPSKIARNMDVPCSRVSGISKKTGNTTSESAKQVGGLAPGGEPGDLRSGCGV